MAPIEKGESGSEGKVVAVVGATGAVGQDLVRALELSAFPVRELRLVASRANPTPAMEVGGDRIRVHPIPHSCGASPLFEEVDLVFFATPPEVTRLHAPGVASNGVAVIDVGGGLADRAPLVVPAVTREPLSRFSEVRIACSPSAPAVVLSTVLSALQPLGLSGARGTVLLSAGAAGRAGVEELSAQVIALFNSGDPPRKVFPGGLAFDVVGQVGPPEPGTGWTAAERRLAAEVSDVLAMPGDRFAFDLALAPLFAGVVAWVHAEVDPEPDLESVRAALAETPTVRVGDPVPGPRRLAGKGGVYAGRLRLSPRGGGVHLYAAADNLRFGASANAVAIAMALSEEGLL